MGGVGGAAAKVGDWAFKGFTAALGVATVYLGVTFSVNVYRGLSWHNSQSGARAKILITRYYRNKYEIESRVSIVQPDLLYDPTCCMTWYGSRYLSETCLLALCGVVVPEVADVVVVRNLKKKSDTIKNQQREHLELTSLLCTIVINRYVSPTPVGW
ncbi:hypothetical protein AKJ16_DCAP13128 [Drosera capensis]